jgi:hypothetical protein
MNFKDEEKQNKNPTCIYSEQKHNQKMFKFEGAIKQK